MPFSPPGLISGVHTSDILTVYISAIKALRELDPSMVILQVACQPIRKYLRSDGSFLTFSFITIQSVFIFRYKPGGGGCFSDSCLKHQLFNFFSVILTSMAHLRAVETVQ